MRLVTKDIFFLAFICFVAPSTFAQNKGPINSTTYPKTPDCIAILDGKAAYVGGYNLDNPKFHLLNEILSKSVVSAPAIIMYLSQHPLLKRLNLEMLYRESAGVREGYSLGVHTQMVLGVFKELERFIVWDEIESSLPVRELFIFMLAVHDIGKPESLRLWVEARDGVEPNGYAELREATKNQHEHTMRITREIMEALGFSEKEVSFVAAFLDNDILGEVTTYDESRGKGVSAEEAYLDIVALSQVAGLSPRDYFLLKSLYFNSDAGSYPGLRYGRYHGEHFMEPIFYEGEGGEIYPIAENYHRLAEMVEIFNTKPYSGSSR